MGLPTFIMNAGRIIPVLGRYGFSRIPAGNRSAVRFRGQLVPLAALFPCIDSKLRVLLIGLILQTIWEQWGSADYAGYPLILVLDGCQNLSWSGQGMAVRLLREGRKYDLAGWFSSQWLDSKTALAALGQASLQIHFQPDAPNINRLAKLLCGTKPSEVPQYRQLVQTLRAGQCLWHRTDGQVVVVNVDV